MESEQGLNQTGRSTAEPCLEQNQPNTSGIGSRTGSTTGFRIGPGAGCRIVPEPISPSIQARVESMSVDPLTLRPWKHQSSHPLIKFCLTLIYECKLDPN